MSPASPPSATRSPAARRPREEQLRQAAVRLFRQNGYHATSMQDLAEALGLHRGSLYHYIDAKEDLLASIVEGIMARFTGDVLPILEGDGDPAERLRLAVAAHLRIAAECPDELTLAQVELKALSGERAARVVAARDAYEHAWRELIRGGVATGRFRCVDVRSAGFVILAACNWFSQWYHPSGPRSVDEFAASYSDLFLGALGADDGGGGTDEPGGAVSVEAASDGR